MRPDCHLVRTAIPSLPVEDSLGDFHHSLTASLASFAKRVSMGDRRRRLWPEPCCCVDPTSTRLTQGRLRLHTALRPPRGPMHRTAGSQSASYTGRKYHQGSTSVHKSRSPRKQGRHNHAIGKRPESASAENLASPQHPPETGRIKQAPEVSSMCPSEDF